MATYINNNVKFHAFSKSPVSPDTTLGGAVNPSGHTITTSQVRAQDIPAFLNTFQGTKDQALTWLETNYATPAHNDIVFYGGEFKAGFSTPKCLKYNAKAETPAWEDFDITAASTLKNVDDKDVIAVHQDCTTVFVDGGNNAATNSNRWALFVKKSDGSILDHFVASTDKIVAGMPSLGYNALVMWDGAAIDEGELDANYVGNTFAGIVHLNKQYNTGDDAKFTVTCFEYIGEKLDASLANIDDEFANVRKDIQDIVDVTMEGVVASVGANTAAQNAGIGVDSTTKTSPKITFTAGTISETETKLVTGATVKTYVDNTAASVAETKAAEAIAAELAEGGSIKAAADAAQSAAEATAAGALESAVETINGTIESTQSTLQAAIDTKVSSETYTTKVGELEAAITKAKTDAEKTASDALAAARTEITAEIATAKSGAEKTASDALAAARTQITAEIATAKSGAEKTASDALAAAKTELEGKITAAQTAAQDYADDAVDALETKLTTAEGSLGSKVTALEGSVKTITETTIPGAISDLKTELTTGVIKTAQDTANQAVTDAAAALAEAQKRISKVSEGTDSSLLTVETTGTEVTITLDGDVATKTHVAEQIKTVTDAATTLTGRVTTAEGKIKTLEETTVPAVKTIAEQGVADAKAADDKAVAAANAITTLGSTTITEKSVGGAGITVTLKGSVKAPTIEGGVTTASYTKASGETPGSWTNEANVATGTAVKDALTDVASAHSKDIQTLQTAINGLTTTGLTREVLPDGQTTANITDPKANVIYLVKDATSETGAYVEYLYVDGTFEAIGTTSTDLSEYAKTGGSTKTIADLATEVATAQSEVDALEGVVSALSQTQASDKATLEASIKAVSDKVGTTDVAGQITAAIEALDVAKHGDNGIELTQTDGKVALTVNADDTVTASSTNVVTSGAVATAVATVASAASAAQTTAEAKVESITTSDGRITLTPSTSGKVKSVAVALAAGVATTTDGTAYSKGETDTKISDAITALNSTTTTNGITVTLTAGKVTAVSAAAGQVVAGDTDVVTGGVVNTAIENTKSEIGGWFASAYNDINDKVNSISLGEESSSLITVSTTDTPINDGHVVKRDVTIALDPKVATTDDIDSAVQGIKLTSCYGSELDKRNSKLWGLNGLSNGFVNIENNDFPVGGIKVEDNLIYDSDGAVICPIRSERFLSLDTPAYINNGPSSMKWNITSWSGDLSKLKTSHVEVSDINAHTFESCPELHTFVGDLSSLTDGTRMFYNCPKLETVITDLSSLERGNGMFSGCTLLSDESLFYIVDSLPTYEYVAEAHMIHIGAPNAENYRETLRAKGWTLVIA